VKEFLRAEFGPEPEPPGRLTPKAKPIETQVERVEASRQERSRGDG
jgi:hypothetical protein